MNEPFIRVRKPVSYAWEPAVEAPAPEPTPAATRKTNMIDWLRSLLQLPSEVRVMRARIDVLELENKNLREESAKQYSELKAASTEQTPYILLDEILLGRRTTRSWTAIDAVKLLLAHQNLTVQPVSGNAPTFKLVPIKKARAR